MPAAKGNAMRELPEKDMAAYERLRESLEKEHWGQWALIADEGLVDTFDEFEEAIEAADKWFGSDPCHIRQVGVEGEIQPSFLLIDSAPCHAVSR